jgi:hypothetical protein
MIFNSIIRHGIYARASSLKKSFKPFKTLFRFLGAGCHGGEFGFQSAGKNGMNKNAFGVCE